MSAQSRLQSRASRTPYDKNFVRAVVLQEKNRKGSTGKREVLYDTHYSVDSYPASNSDLRFQTMSTTSLDGHERKKKRQKRRATSHLNPDRSSPSSSPTGRSSSFASGYNSKKYHSIDSRTQEMIFGRNNRPKDKVNVKVHSQSHHILISLLFLHSNAISQEKEDTCNEQIMFSAPKTDQKRRRANSLATNDGITNAIPLRSFAKMEQKPKPLSQANNTWKRSTSLGLSELTPSPSTPSPIMPSVHRSASIPIQRKREPNEEEDEEDMSPGAGHLIESSPSHEGEVTKPNLKDSFDLTSNEDAGSNSTMFSSPSAHCDEFEDTENSNTSVVSLTLIFELLPKNSAVQDLIVSHFAVIHYRCRVLLEILFHALQKTMKQLINEEEPNPEIGKFMLNCNDEFDNAAQAFQRFFCTLMTFPRLQPPAWLQIITLNQKRKTLVCELLKEITRLQGIMPPQVDDATGLSFSFLSRVISTLLVYHTSWVSTVVCDEKTRKDGRNGVYSQLSQLFGRTDRVNRTCKVVVIGENSSFVNSVLFVLSFFMRSCSLTQCQNEKLSETGIHQTIQKYEAKKRNSGGKNRVLAFAPLLDVFGDSKYVTNICTDKKEKEHELHFVASLNVVEKSVISSTIPPASSNPYKVQARSLFGAFCKSYASDFALMGVHSRAVSLGTDLQYRISGDLWAQCKFWPTGDRESLLKTPPSSTNGKFTLESASCIVINLDVLSCEIFTYQPHFQDVPLHAKQLATSIPNFYVRSLPPSYIIEETIENLNQMWKVDVPPDACMLYLEERLAYFHKKSLVVQKLLEEHNPTETIFECSTMARILQIPSRYDVELLATLQDQCAGNRVSSFLNPC